MNSPATIAEWLTPSRPDDGAVRGPWLGREAVLHYGDPAAEYAALTADAGLVDLSDRTQVEVSGAERAAFLNRMATNKLDRLAPGAGCETLLTDAKGHVVAHVLAFVAPESIVLDTAPGQASSILAHLSRYIIRDRVELHDRSNEWFDFLLAGPNVSRVLGALVGESLPTERLAHGNVRLATETVSLRSLQAEPPAYLVAGPVSAAKAVWEAIRQAGVRPCGRLAAEAFRIEAGWPEYGRDITSDNLPQEIGRDNEAISFNKGCYLGQETVARIESRGHVNKMLVGLKFASREVPAPGTELTAAGVAVGRVTSSAFSPQFDASIGLGYVRRGHAKCGSQLHCSLGPVEVVALPVARRSAAGESLALRRENAP